MHRLYRSALQIAETTFHSLLMTSNWDPKSPSYGKLTYESGIHEPGVCFGFIERATDLYLCEDSRYYKKPIVLDTLRALCIAAHDGLHEDGTNDLIISNYRQPEFFSTPFLNNAYRMLSALPNKTEEEHEITEMIYSLVERAANGLLSSGFHTPNHRWVHTAALYHSYNTLKHKDERLVTLAQKYLAEKIDIDEYGEFSERSAGMYSAVSDTALCDIAVEANMPELFDLVKRNLLLVYRFIEKDDLIFTQNSRRKDKGEVASSTLFNFDRYVDVCLNAYVHTRDLTFLQILQNVLDKRTDPQPVHTLLRFYLLYPELKDIHPDFSLLPPLAEEFHVFYERSNIVREKEHGVVYSLLAGNPYFLHITCGEIGISARMCSSFFAKAQFIPDRIERLAERHYRLAFHTWADYKLPFDEPPMGSENYWSMDYKSRKSISRCDYGYTLDVTFTESGLSMHVVTDGTERVPFKLEFAVTPGAHVRAGHAMTIATAGSFLSVSGGNVTLSNYGGDRLTIKGAFAKHFYHKDMRGSLPAPRDQYMIYFTDFSPVDRTVEIVCKRECRRDYFDSDTD